MSGMTNAATILTLVSEPGTREYHGPVAVSTNPTSTTGNNDWLKEIWASSHPDHSEAFTAAHEAAKGVHGPQVAHLLGSSFFGRAAQVVLDREHRIHVAATKMEKQAASGHAKPLVTRITAWTDASLMSAEEKAEFEKAGVKL